MADRAEFNIYAPFLQLDKFALSADINVASEIKHAYAAYRAAYSTSPYASPLPSPRVLTPTLPAFDSLLSNGSSISPRLRPNSALTSPSAPVVPQSDLQYLRALASPSPSPLIHAYTTMQPCLRTYLSDLFSATRHHPELDGTLLTHRAHVYADVLARAFRVLAGDSIGAGLVRAVGAGDQASDLWEASEEGLEGKQEDMSGTQGASSPLSQEIKSPVKVELDGVEIVQDGQWEDFSAPPRTESETITSSGNSEAWDVSEVDIARIFPRVASHRLRVLDGPEEEVLGSLVWPAVQVMPRGEQVASTDRKLWVRKTVKEILVGILADV